MKIDEMRKVAREGGLITPKRKEAKPVEVKYTKVCESDGCSNRIELASLVEVCPDCEEKMKSSGVKGLPTPCGPAHYGSVAVTCFLHTGFFATGSVSSVSSDFFGAPESEDEEDKKADSGVVSSLRDDIEKLRTTKAKAIIPGTSGWSFGPKKDK